MQTVMHPRAPEAVNHPILEPAFGTDGLLWPPVPMVGPGGVRRILEVLEHSQWLPPAQLLEYQLLQAATVLRHAHATVPFYRERLGAAGYDPAQPLTPARFQQLPLLRRRDIQRGLHALFSEQLPTSHGRHYDGKTSGSTGRPIHFRGSAMVNAFWRALTIRDHLWQQRDFNGSYAVIRALVPNDRHYPDWGSATAGLFQTGPSYTLDIRNDFDTQIRWLLERQPAYLLTYPTSLRGLLERCRSRSLRFPGLKQVCAVSESLDQSIHTLCHDVLGLPLSDCYSAEETGYIALQCPQSGLYHIQSEHLLVEILNEADAPCAPGEAGRVMITTLANFAMPLIRYEIMDYATIGPPCPCGRGLPTLTQILGRQRNLVTLPDGRRYWPLLGYHQWMNTLPIEQIQLVQKSLTRIEVRYVSPRPLTASEFETMGQAIQQALRYPFPLAFIAVQDIPRNASGKYEDFISEIDPGRWPDNPASTPGCYPR